MSAHLTTCIFAFTSIAMLASCQPVSAEPALLIECKRHTALTDDINPERNERLCACAVERADKVFGETRVAALAAFYDEWNTVREAGGDPDQGPEAARLTERDLFTFSRMVMKCSIEQAMAEPK